MQNADNNANQINSETDASGNGLGSPGVQQAGRGSSASGPVDDDLTLIDQAVRNLADEKPIDMNQKSDIETGGHSHSNENIFRSLPVELQVVIGKAKLTVEQLLAIGVGATVPLDKLIGEPVDICVNGSKIATGELFVLEESPDRIGVRLLDIKTN